MSLTAVITTASHNMRMLTFSWEAIHPMTKSLFGPSGAPRLFKLQNVRRDPPLIRLPPGQEISDIIGNSPDTTLNFSQLTLHDACRMSLGQSNINALEMEVPMKLDLVAQICIRTPTLIRTGGHFCLILCNTRERQIFDMRSRQICVVKLTCSKSEMEEQLSWFHRVQATS